MFPGLNVLGKIFGSEKALGKIVNSAVKGIDALSYTEEEKSHDAAKQRERARDQVIEFMVATQGQNIARRLIALIIVSVWACCFLVSNAMAIASVFIEKELAGRLMEASSLINANISDVETEVMIVVGFYFGAPHLQGLFDALTKRKIK